VHRRPRAGLFLGAAGAGEERRAADERQGPGAAGRGGRDQELHRVQARQRQRDASGVEQHARSAPKRRIRGPVKEFGTNMPSTCHSSTGAALEDGCAHCASRSASRPSAASWRRRRARGRPRRRREVAALSKSRAALARFGPATAPSAPPASTHEIARSPCQRGAGSVAAIRHRCAFAL
jgi:hypothetical protein